MTDKVLPMYALKYTTGFYMAPLGVGGYEELIETKEWTRDSRLFDYRKPSACSSGWHATPFSHWWNALDQRHRQHTFLVEVKGDCDLTHTDKGAFEYIRFVDELTTYTQDIYEALHDSGGIPSCVVNTWASWLELPKGSRLFWRNPRWESKQIHYKVVQ